MNAKTVFEPEGTRQTIAEVLPKELATYGEAPAPRFLYVPRGHTQALSPDHALVVGIRGAGKSVWWAALQSEDHRRVIARALPRLALGEKASVDAGFGLGPRPDDYPDKHTLRKLLRDSQNPVEIWRTVIAWHTWGKARRGRRRSPLAELGTWRERVAWLEEHPEETARSFKTHDDKLAAKQAEHLVLFDALDHAADDWQDLRRLLRGLLEVLLEFRAYRAIRAKAFVRPDMLDDSEVTAFRDASKVIAGKVELRWSRADLYALLFQHLGNAPEDGDAFRWGCQEFGSTRWFETGGIWQLPEPLREKEDLQRKVFHDLAGPWMGRDHRRGFPYTWLPSHLGDARGQVSPRSFLAAVQAAAAESSAGHDWPHALYYSGIKTGVREASRIRVEEIEEDYPWVRIAMKPLWKLVVPCEYDEIRRRWQERKVLQELKKHQDGLQPKHLEEGLPGLRHDLLELALFSEARDGRINMPDVYRVGFGLGRRGGVRPIR